MARTAADAAALLGAIAGPDPDEPTALQNPVPDYLAGIGTGVTGRRIGIDRTLIAAGADADIVRATEETAAALAQIGALLQEVSFPSPDDVVRVAIPLCSVEAAVAHEATYPVRAGEYGPVLAGLLETGRTLDGLAVKKMLLCREAFRGRLNALFRDIDLLIMPAMNVAAPTLADMTPARRTPAATEGHLDEGLVLRAGHAFQEATEWHRRRGDHPSIETAQFEPGLWYVQARRPTSAGARPPSTVLRHCTT